MKELNKFGGTSVDCLDQIITVINSRKKYNPYVCVSAFSGVTDVLIKLIDKAKKQESLSSEDIDNLKNIHLEKIRNGLSNEEDINFLKEKFEEFFNKLLINLKISYNNLLERDHNPIDYDTIIGIGEQISAFLISELLTFKSNKNGFKGKFINLENVMGKRNKKTDEAFYKKLRDNIEKKINEEKSKDTVLIMTGFIGYFPEGITHIIGRGYTDYTGALVASIIKADKYIIFKEVDGICSADPSILKGEFILLPELSYREVFKMSSGGMKAINTEAVKPAMNDGIPIEVRNSFTPNKEGTLIVAKRKLDPNKKIQNISIKSNVCVIRFGGLSYNAQKFELILMELLDKYELVKFFSTSDRAGTSVVLSYEDKIEKLLDELKKYGNAYIIKNCAIVAIVGEEMKGDIHILSEAVMAITSTNSEIYTVVQGGSQVGIDFVIDEKNLNKVVESLHDNFFGYLNN